MNYIIFLDRVGLMFILERDYSSSDSCSKQILSRSFMFDMRIKSPKEYTLYPIQGEKINRLPKWRHEMPWGFVRRQGQCALGRRVCLSECKLEEMIREPSCHSPLVATLSVKRTPPFPGCHRNQLSLPHQYVTWPLVQVTGYPRWHCMSIFCAVTESDPSVCSVF